MAVVEGKSSLIRDYKNTTTVSPDPEFYEGRLIVQTGEVANAATDSAASLYHLADVHADGIPQPETYFAVAGDGFAQIVIGTKTDADALVDQTKASEAIVTPFDQGGALHGKRWWEVLGLAERPRGEKIGLWKHAEAAATGAGVTKFRLVYAVSDR